MRVKWFGRFAMAVRAAGEERAVVRMRSQHCPIALLPLPEPTTRQSTAPLRQRLTVDRRMDNSVCCDDRRHTAAATLLYPGFMTSDSNKITYCHARCCPPSWFHSGQLLSKNETHRCLQLTAPNSSDDTQFRRQHVRTRAALRHRAPLLGEVREVLLGGGWSTSTMPGNGLTTPYLLCHQWRLYA